MNGGLLVQNVNGHAIGYTHAIDNGEFEYQITSTHHQMQYPFILPSKDYSILFKSSDNRSDIYQGDKINSQIILEKGEPEIVLYHKDNYPKCLAVQGHPEMIPDSPVAEMINLLIHNLVNNGTI